MKKYKNLDGNSGILAWEEGKDYIIVQFSDFEKYLYNYIKPGKMLVERMKQFAGKGKGLATFINKYVRSNYYKKLT
jgi:hypothetical protein